MTVLRTYRRLLTNPALVRLLVGEFVSSIGDWLYLVALLVVVYAESQDAVLLGIVGAARVVPYVLLSIPAGIAADRFDRRKILIGTDLVRGAIMVALAAVVAVDGPLVAVVVLALLAACFSTFFGPAIGAFLPSLVTDETELGPANSAWASLDNLAFIIGPAIAGLLIATSGLTLAFLLNAVSFGIVAIVLWRLPRPVGKSASEASVPGPTLSSSVASAESSPSEDRPAGRSLVVPLIGIVVVDAVGSFVFGGLGVLTVVLAVSIAGADESATGYLNAAIGVGGLLGAAASAVLVLRRNLVVPLVIGAAVMGLGVAGLGWSGSLPLALGTMAAAALGSLVVEVVSETIFQRIVPDVVRGRALGIRTTLGTLAYAGGSLAIPVLATSIGVAPVLFASGLAVPLAALVAAVFVGASARHEASPYSADFARVADLPIFAGLPPGRLESAVRRLLPLSTEPGEVVVRQGEPADRFYVISRGSFTVSQASGPGEPELPLRTLGPGDVFGEIGLLRGIPRTATVKAESVGLLLALERDDFLALVGAGPAIGARLLDLYRGPLPGA